MPFTLIIQERGYSWAGRPPRESSHATREEAEAELLDYVRANWDTELDSDEPPDDPEGMVKEYFADVLESYTITEQSA
ncbi:MAG: hypothetical protein WAL45_12790 [Terracidiphilus sp.]